MLLSLIYNPSVCVLNNGAKIGPNVAEIMPTLEFGHGLLAERI